MTSATPAPPEIHEAAPPHPPLRRTLRHKVVAGVCGGLGRHFDLDPVIFRVATGVLAVAGGIGLIFYGFAWLLIPAEGEDENEGRRLLSGRVEGASLTAVLMALVGCGLFLSMLGANGGTIGFAILLAFGISGAAVWSQRRRLAGGPVPGPVPRHAAGGPGAGPDPGPGRESATPAAAMAHAVAEAPPETQAPPPPDAPSWWRDPIVKDGSTGPVPVGYLWGPPDTPPPTAPVPGPQQPWGWGADVPVPPGRPPAPRGPRPIGGLALLLALLAGAIGTTVSWETHPLATSLQIGLVCALAAFGLGLVVSSFLGRTGFGTVFMTVVTALLLAAVSVLPRDISTQWGRTEVRPTAVADVNPHYDLGNGHAILDFSGLAVPSGRTVRTSAELGMGALEVVVPRNATVTVHAEVDAGEVQLPGMQGRGGPNQDVTSTIPPPEGITPGGTLELNLEVALGLVEVSRAAS